MFETVLQKEVKRDIQCFFRSKSEIEESNTQNISRNVFI